MELGHGCHPLGDRHVDRGDALPRDPDHCFGDVDAGDPIAAAGEVLAQPARAAPDVEHLCPHTQPEPLHDVGEGSEALAELVARRNAEGFRAEPQLAAGADLLDVRSVAAVVVVPEALEPATLAAGQPLLDGAGCLTAPHYTPRACRCTRRSSATTSSSSSCSGAISTFGIAVRSSGFSGR